MRNTLRRLIWVLVIICTASIDYAVCQSSVPNYEDLRPCSKGSLELSLAGPNDAIEPCVIAVVEPSHNVFPRMVQNRSATVTMVHVTPASCRNHRDGAITGVNTINNHNDGKGVKIGFHEDHFVQFRLVSVVAGNSLTTDHLGYLSNHAAILESMIVALEPDYIIGTCSFVSNIEKSIAEKYSTILMAQVGPPAFYAEKNPWVFGFHVNSDTYPLSALRQLQFYASSGEGSRQERESSLEMLAVRVLYRDHSDFFYSTCRSAADEATRSGFLNVTEIAYDPEADQDNDGVPNQFDVDFLESLADKACPPRSSEKHHFHPALFVCVQHAIEVDTIINQWKKNGCLPTLLWLTPATWNWALENPQVNPYMQGGSQWHSQFDYSDDYFKSGNDLLSYNEHVFGYRGTYDMVGSYAIVTLFAIHLHSHYRIVNEPNVRASFANPYSREQIRRSLIMLNAYTIFGPFSANNDHQRNTGRHAAGIQWLPLASLNSAGRSRDFTDGHHDEEFVNACIFPLSQAEAATVLPVPSSTKCGSGEFVSMDRISTDDCLLCSKCDPCPTDTFLPDENEATQCTECPKGSTTEESIGSSFCIKQDLHLVPSGLLTMSYVFLFCNWSLAIGFIIWCIAHRKDPVVRLGQIEFLILTCVGAILSSSAMLALSISVPSGNRSSTYRNSLACLSFPFLHALGWMLQYSSLSAKTFRLYTLFHTPSSRRRKLSAHDMYKIIAVPLVVDLVFIIVWTVLDPLEYAEIVTGTSVDPETGLVTVSIVGSCHTQSSIWMYAGPLLGIHLILMFGTNYLLYSVRSVGARYQEQKYVALASVYVCEILFLGLPVLVAVRDSPEAIFIVLVGIIFLHDSGLLCLVFVPKIAFQRQGLPEGMTVGQSVISGGPDGHNSLSTRGATRRGSDRTWRGSVAHSDSSVTRHQSIALGEQATVAPSEESPTMPSQNFGELNKTNLSEEPSPLEEPPRSHFHRQNSKNGRSVSSGAGVRSAAFGVPRISEGASGPSTAEDETSVQQNVLGALPQEIHERTIESPFNDEQYIIDYENDPPPDPWEDPVETFAAVQNVVLDPSNVDTGSNISENSDSPPDPWKYVDSEPPNPKFQ